MRITELFTAQSIALDVAAPDQAAILDKLVDLQATHGNITDKDAYKKALYAREAERHPPTWTTASRCPTPAQPA